MKKTIAAFLAVNLILGTAAFAAPAPTPTAQPMPEAEEIQETPPPTEEPAVTEEPAETEEEAQAPEEEALPSASPTPSPSSTPRPPERELSTEFTLDMVITQHKYIQSKNAVIELYNSKGELLGSQLRYVGWDTPKVTMTFEVPEYRLGEKFTIKLVEGLRSIKYYDKMAQEGETLEVETYGYAKDNGEYVANPGAAVNANPHYDKEIKMYVTSRWLDNVSPHARIVDEVTMMPVRAIGEAMGLRVNYYPETDCVVCSIGSKSVTFYANKKSYSLFGEWVDAPHETCYIDGSLFVPVRTLAEAFDCSLEVTDYGEHIDILIGESPDVAVERQKIPVNRDGIGSRTNYLVWVSKHEYKVRVYEGQQYHWKQLKEFPCALGAWNTPTVTGQFEYIERTRWDYGSYYVGPVLRFYNGYALHSTLLNYGGGEYDGRVGVNISHGCVRLHPQDINWIADTIPFHTRIYITE